MVNDCQVDVGDWWVRALYLEELIEQCGKLPQPGEADSRFLIQDWQARGHLDEVLLDRVLAQRKLSRQQFAGLLFQSVVDSWQPDAQVQPLHSDQNVREWQQTIAAILDDWDRWSQPVSLCSEPKTFAHLAQPFLAYTWHKLRPKNHPALEMDGLRDFFLQNLDTRVRALLQRTLVLELNRARMDGRLKGATPQARYHDFCAALIATPEAWQRLFFQYQVLARQLANCLGQWVASVNEMLDRLEADWPLLEARWLRGRGKTRLSALNGGAGDSHRQGRTVWMLTFTLEDGTSKRLVYKPRDLGPDRCFQSLLDWLNRQTAGDFPKLGSTDSLARDGYGWQNFVSCSPCDNPDQLTRYFTRLGGLTAILYLLGGYDVHQENLIAHGEFPVLIDLETLFHPRLPEPEAETAAETAKRMIRESVIGIGLLPRWISGEKGRGINLSAVGDQREQQTPEPVPTWEDVRTDQMKQVMRHQRIENAENLPRLGEETVSPLPFLTAFKEGFGVIYRILAAQGHRLAEPGGPIHRFKKACTRFVTRPTQIYGMLLHDAAHPDHLRQGTDMDRLLELLWKMCGGNAAMERLVPAEQAALRRRDIPYFSTRPDSRSLFSDEGKLLTGIFAVSGWNCFRERLNNLGQEDLTRQLQFIDGSWQSLAKVSHQTEDRVSVTFDTRQQVSPQRVDGAFRDLAVGLGDRLLATRVCGEDTDTWIGLVSRDGHHWQFDSLGSDLYEGTAGIALFLGYLGELSGEERFTRCACKIAGNLCRNWEDEWGAASLGAFTGFFSELYCLQHLAALWREPTLLTEANRKVVRLSGTLAKDEVHDVIGGCAGAMAVLLNGYALSGDNHLLTGAKACADHLARRAQTFGAGKAWPNASAPNRPPLLGFSHGAGGIAAMLTAVAEVLDSEPGHSSPGHASPRHASPGHASPRHASPGHASPGHASPGHAGPEHAGLVAHLDDLIRAAFRYERDHFDSVRGNWPFFQEESGDHDEPLFHNAWCHGAPGISLSRLLALRRYRDDAALTAECHTAMATMITKGPGGNHGLCHGELGNLIIMDRIARTWSSPAWEDQVQKRKQLLLKDLQLNGPRCGVPNLMETQGLMLGLAGIGMGLLTLAEPDRIPLILALAPPHLERSI